ncbi:sigma-70 family RNA polymerase sigma factor [Actinomadura sp. ATCC 31491]|uniref:Sigma-70 family RNA polymerase sigma factor n=1 Tax=Actinomadura luzonensis TaxID=2805427 RepID=A0ABT0FX47_9ACTN|nr:sigma-70 family RNA polymerase sigma factor [Actinomadura luzonensis]MCK2216920.1 sigma-70 family RNA polymerase sigma factor [Actinomadura luzonensis]
MPGTDPTEVFAAHRELLFSMVYNMLGSVSDTEDVLQETWLAWAARSGDGDLAAVEHPRAYLVRVAVNQALAQQSALRRRRESYVGSWLPEPLLTGPAADKPAADGPSADGQTAESVSLAMLETLSPLERAVFILHEVFAYRHTEIAALLGRNPAAVRQLAHRAREHVRARRPRRRVDARTQREVTERFLAAAFGGDLEALLKLLAPEVTLWYDGGADRPARPVHGADKVARVLTGTAARLAGAAEVRYREVNGDPSAVVFVADAPYAVMVVDLTPDGTQVSGVYTVGDPGKLGHVREDG